MLRKFLIAQTLSLTQRRCVALLGFLAIAVVGAQPVLASYSAAQKAFTIKTEKCFFENIYANFPDYQRSSYVDAYIGEKLIAYFTRASPDTSGQAATKFC